MTTPAKPPAKFIRRYFHFGYPAPQGMTVSMDIPNYGGLLEEIVLEVSGALTLPRAASFYEPRDDEEASQSTPWGIASRITLRANITHTLLDVTGEMARLLAYLQPDNLMKLPCRGPTRRGRNLWRVPYHFRFTEQLLGNAYLPIQLGGGMTFWRMTLDMVSDFGAILNNARGAEWTGGMVQMHLVTVHAP